MPYRLEYLPRALKDMWEIAAYIADELQNPLAAQNLIEELIVAAENIRMFPHAQKVYELPRPLTHEYRRIIVKNYPIFYYVTEQKHLITVARIVYGKRNTKNLFK